MSDHPEVPRVEFHADGHSMNIRQAVSRFQSILLTHAKDYLEDRKLDKFEFTLTVEIRTCDCESDIRGRDDYCPLHGDKADGYDDGESKYPLPEWCCNNACEDPRCHRCFPRPGCSKHEKCRAAS